MEQVSWWREGCHLRAWELQKVGWSQVGIPEVLGVTPDAVSQWIRRAREGRGAALRKRVAPGASPRLAEAQQARVLGWLREGAETHGFRDALWRRTRIAALSPAQARRATTRGT